MSVTVSDDVLVQARLRRSFPLLRPVSPPPERLPTARAARLLPLLSGPRPFTVLVAPAGYGKTTLLRAWCALDPRPSGWLTLNDGHDNPLPLLRAIARTADDVFARAHDRGGVLVIDAVQHVRSAGARETLAGVLREPPAGLAIVLASRAELPLPIARLSAEGLVTELRTSTLAMTREEAAELCAAAGLRVDAEALDALMRQTEGWPAALALAAVGVERDPSEQSLTRLDGRDRLVADYVRDEILAPLDDGTRAFLAATAALDVLSGPLCDAALERTGSALQLAELQRGGFPLVPIDRNGERLRHHRLVRAVLLAELQRTAPGHERVLHRRASAWHERAGQSEAALRHALAAEDPARACAIVWAATCGCAERAAGGMLEHWLELFRRDAIAATPRLALVAAASQLDQGQGELAEHWLRRAAAGVGGDAQLAAGILALQAILGRDGLAAMGATAADAAAQLAPDSPAQALCRLAAGVAAHLSGDPSAARPALEEGARRAAVQAPQLHALCLAQLALLALDDGEREAAAGLISRARAQVERFRLDRHPSSALVLAVSALVRAQRGRIGDAVRDVAVAGPLLERLTDFAAWYTAEAQLVLARAALRLSDIAEARRRHAAAALQVRRIADADTLAEWLRVTEAEIETYRQAVCEVRFPLTTAELKVLQFLPTHLSFRQIGELTCVTANTVKTQANAAYRKLDVRSRTEAVVRARALGLVD